MQCAPDSLESVLFLASGLAVSTEDPDVSGPDRQILREAIEALELAREIRELPPPYQAALARCYFGAGRFYEAAAHYELLIEKELPGAWSLLSSYVYRALGTSYISAEEPAKAIKALQTCSSRFPMETDIYLMTAKVQAQETDYQAVIETIRKATDNIPGFDEDWRHSSLLAIGGVDRPPGAILKATKVDPHIRDGIAALLCDYWPPFEKLSDKAKEQWVKGAFLCHFLSGQQGIVSMTSASASAWRPVNMSKWLPGTS